MLNCLSLNFCFGFCWWNLVDWIEKCIFADEMVLKSGEITPVLVLKSGEIALVLVLKSGKIVPVLVLKSGKV